MGLSNAYIIQTHKQVWANSNLQLKGLQLYNSGCVFKKKIYIIPAVFILIYDRTYTKCTTELL